MKLATTAIATLTILFTSTAALHADVEYILTDLGTLGGSMSRADGINAGGQVCGGSTESTGYVGNPDTVFVTAAGSPINPLTDGMGNFGGTYAIPWRINDHGQIAAELSDADGNYHAARADAGDTLSVATHSLGTFGGSYSWARDINNAGQVVGTAQLSGGAAYHAFRTSGNTLNQATDDLGTLGGARSWGTGINSLGQVVGYSYLAGQDVPIAFRTAPNSSINPATDNLGTLGGPLSFAHDINDSGQVVGASENVSEIYHAFRTAPNSAINPATDDLGTLGGPRSDAKAINSDGLVVGWSEVTTSTNWHAFLYRDSEMLDLNDMIDPNSGWELKYAADINDAGQIVGHGIVGGNRHAFLLTPIPEPSTFLLLAAGSLCGLSLSRRRNRKLT